MFSVQDFVHSDYQASSQYSEFVTSSFTERSILWLQSLNWCHIWISFSCWYKDMQKLFSNLLAYSVSMEGIQCVQQGFKKNSFFLKVCL